MYLYRSCRPQGPSSYTGERDSPHGRGTEDGVVDPTHPENHPYSDVVDGTTHGSSANF